MRTAFLIAAAFLAACAHSGFAPTAPSSSANGAPLLLAAKGGQNVYWTLFADPSYPQLQIAKVPLQTTSKVTEINHTKQNGLLYTSGLTIDSAGRLWILSNGQNNGSPTSVLVFKLPISKASRSIYRFVLSGTSQSDALAFDSSGKLWVTSPGNSSALQYTGPFTKSQTLEPALTISGVGSEPYGIAVDSSASVYISNANSSGKDSIRVLKPPYKSAYFLDGLTGPGGLIFDAQGDSYASSDSAKSSAVVRYDHNHLRSGDKPSIVDSKGLKTGSYEAAFAFTATGDLYAANCGKSSSTAGVDVWPLSQKKFSAKLAPSVEYSNADISGTGCVWGIAIK